jgi:ParB family chromosome partitioning protein
MLSGLEVRPATLALPMPPKRASEVTDEVVQLKAKAAIGKLFAAYLRHAEESALGGLLVEITILHAATRQTAAQVLRDAATTYKVDADAISLKVKHEFAAKEKAKLAPKPAAKAVPPKAKKAA